MRDITAESTLHTQHILRHVFSQNVAIPQKTDAKIFCDALGARDDAFVFLGVYHP